MTTEDEEDVDCRSRSLRDDKQERQRQKPYCWVECFFPTLRKCAKDGASVLSRLVRREQTATANTEAANVGGLIIAEPKSPRSLAFGWIVFYDAASACSR